ncbi:methyltransferase domain-containing protein, partial [Colletotrichum abscissum]
KLAAEYDTKYEKTILQLEKEIRKRKDFIGADWVIDDDDDDSESESAAQSTAANGRSVRLLDYACGTGLISRALAQFTTHCVGIDISENMVAAYNARAENQVRWKDDSDFCLVQVGGSQNKATERDESKIARFPHSDFRLSFSTYTPSPHLRHLTFGQIVLPTHDVQTGHPSGK